MMRDFFHRIWLFVRVRRAAELDDELLFHIEQSTQAKLDAGMSPSEAHRQAMIEFGGMERTREQTHQQRPGWFLGAALQDTRYALRGFRRSPLFTAAVVATLALGIGANFAVFTLINGTILRSLPYRAAGDLVEITPTNVSDNNLADVEQLQQQSRTLEGLAYYSSNGTAYLQAGGDQEIANTHISPNLFDVLGAAPVLGRGFMPSEQSAGNGHVVILSDELWRGRFHASAKIVGEAIKIDNTVMTVVGVMPRGFAFPAGDHVAQVWTPAAIDDNSRVREFNASSFSVIARRRKDAPLPAVSAEVNTIQRRLSTLYADATLAPAQLRVESYRSTLSKNERPALLALCAAVGVIWLIACANVANLVLARSTSRQRELAVRAALGASRGRLVRQLLLESTLLSATGCVLGVGLAEALLTLFRRTIAVQIAMPISLQPDIRILLALLALGMLSALTFGAAPAVFAARSQLGASLRGSSAQTGSGRSQQRSQRILVMAEIGLSLAMLVACGLLLKTVFAMRHVPLGFRVDHVYVLATHLPAYKYQSVDVNAVIYKPLLERVQRMHGVEAAAITTIVPLDKGFNMTLQLYLDGGAAKGAGGSKGRILRATVKSTGPDLQKVLGFRMLKGRYFNDQDTPDSPLVAVVNQAFARAYESGDQKNSVNDFSFNFGAGRGFKVVGIIDDFHQTGIAEGAFPEIDLNAAQLKVEDGFYQPTLQASTELAIRATGGERNFIPDLQRVMREFNPDLATNNIRTMDEVVEDAMGSQLLAAQLLEACGGLALTVALMGIYSLLAYLVSLRRRELGLRMALGAQREQILSLILRQAGGLLAGGIALGVGVSLVSGGLLTHFLFGVRPRDFSTFVAASVLMLIAGLLAAWLPARRAASIDPMDSLRAE